MRRHVIFVGVFAFSQSLYAADLLQTFRDARDHDAAYASARAAFVASKEIQPQAFARLLPSINANAETAWNDNPITFRNTTIPGPFPRQYNTNSWAVTLRQPLFHMQDWAQYKESELQAAQAAARFAQATQELIVRVTRAYFDVLLSEDNVAYVQSQKGGISEQLAQVKRDFEVGTANISDEHDAQARYDLASSEEIAAHSDLEIKQGALQQITGTFPQRIAPLSPSAQLEAPQLNSMKQWLDLAEKNSFSVQIQSAGLEIASREVQRARAAHLPTLDVFGSYGESAAGVIQNSTANVGYKDHVSAVGVQLAVPLFAGGAIDSKVREAVANEEKARADLENARRESAQAARRAYLSVFNGMTQVHALQAALTSSQNSLDSNVFGYKLGVRINIDVLNAQQQLFSVKRDLSRARYDTLVSWLQLKAVVGTLSENDLAAINRLFTTD